MSTKCCVSISASPPTPAYPAYQITSRRSLLPSYSLVSFPLREAPMVLFQSSCSGWRSKREEARGFMKVGHYSLQQVIVIVPPTEQMKSRDVLGISIATHTALVPPAHSTLRKFQSFTRSFTGAGEPILRISDSASLFPV